MSAVTSIKPFMNSETTSIEANLLSDELGHDWHKALKGLAYAHQAPAVRAKLKVTPKDFIVTEIMDVTPSGEGEHYWLDISKAKCNTEQLAKALARFANVNARDVGYSGMKDFFAQTRQWFSVWKPKGGVPAWHEFKLDGVTVHQVIKHSRKIKRGTHRSNHFDIVLRDLESIPEGGDGLGSLEQRLTQVQMHGVPNYFGEQRFGRNGDNMNQAYQLFTGQKKVKSRHLKGLLLSSARSWLFNSVVSARVEQGSWQTLVPNEPANLNSTNSVFQSQGGEDETQRLNDNDIHPTAPMWGDGEPKVMQACVELAQWERSIIEPFVVLQQGLESARLDYQRRPIRCIPQAMTWSFEVSDEVGQCKPESHLNLSFELSKGQFATSIIRELVAV